MRSSLPEQHVHHRIAAAALRIAATVVTSLVDQNTIAIALVHPAGRTAQHASKIQRRVLGEEHIETKFRLPAQQGIARPLGQHDQAANFLLHVTRRIILQPSFLDVLNDVCIDVSAKCLSRLPSRGRFGQPAGPKRAP